MNKVRLKCKCCNHYHAYVLEKKFPMVFSLGHTPNWNGLISREKYHHYQKNIGLIVIGFLELVNFVS